MNYNKIIFLLALLCASVGVIFGTDTVYGAGKDYGQSKTADVAGLPKTGDIPSIIGNVVGAGLSLISVLFFILMIYAGIMWMTARGDETHSKKALDTIFAAIIGIIIVLAAYAITNFVLTSVSGGVGGGGSPTTPADDAECKAKGANYACVEGANDTKCESGTIQTGLCHGQYGATSIKCCVPKGSNVGECKLKTPGDIDLCSDKKDQGSCTAGGVCDWIPPTPDGVCKDIIAGDGIDCALETEPGSCDGWGPTVCLWEPK
jgi:LPXTG-motif cell wall-anchored protein